MKGYHHYITTDSAGRILSGWSNGADPRRDITGSVLLREGAGYQFQLFGGGEENPCLTNEFGAHLWRYETGQVKASTPEELMEEQAEIEAAMVPPGPTARQLVQQQITDLDLRDIEQGQTLTDLEIGGNSIWPTY